MGGDSRMRMIRAIIRPDREEAVVDALEGLHLGYPEVDAEKKKELEAAREEFKHFSAFSNPATWTTIPDPQAESSFQQSRLKWEEIEQPPHRGIRALYQRLLHARQTIMRPRTSQSLFS